MKDKIFKKLIQSIDLDEPRQSFTDDIIKTVETEEDLKLNAALISAIQKELLSDPSSDFSAGVMANIPLSGIPGSMISKQIKLTVLSLGVALLVFALLKSSSPLANVGKDSYFSDFHLSLSNTTTEIVQIAGSILSYLVPLSALLLIDYFFRTRQRQLS